MNIRLPRADVRRLIDAHIRGDIKDFSGTPDSLHARVRALGHNCDSLFEMVLLRTLLLA